MSGGSWPASMPRPVHHEAGRFRFLEDPISRSVLRRGLADPSTASNGRFETILGPTYRSASGHKERFPPPRLSGGYGLG